MVEELLRILKYNTLPYRELRRNKTLEPGGLLPSALPVVVYNGESPWAAATNIRELIAPTGPALAALQPSQRFLVLDERHMAADSPHLSDLKRAVVRLEQSRSEADFKLVVDALPHRQASSKFDAKTAGRLAAALEGVSDPERLAEVGEAIVRCETGPELLRR